MKTVKVSLLFLVLSLVFTNIFAQPLYSNVIFLGDSQSDLGNGPEHLTFNPDNAEEDEPFRFNLYVPVSNPVDTSNETMLVNGFSFPTQDNEPDFQQTLPDQLQICNQSNGNCVDRQFRSISWTSYFLYNAMQKVVTWPIDFRPWIIQYQQTSPATIHQSVNYAWYSATTPNQCTDNKQNPVDCTIDDQTDMANSVIQRAEAYRDGQSKYNEDNINLTLFEEMIIPGGMKQVELLKDDIAANRVKVDDRTLYIVWLGANDLGYHSSDGLVKLTKFALTVLPKEIAGRSDSIVSELVDLGAKNILVLSQYNLTLTPGVYGEKIKGAVTRAIFSTIVTGYNKALKKQVGKWQTGKRGKKVPNLNIRFVDIQSPVDDYLKQYFKSTNGQRCDAEIAKENISDNKLVNGEAFSCFNDPDKPIAFENNSHLAAQLQQVVAKTVLDSSLD